MYMYTQTHEYAWNIYEKYILDKKNEWMVVENIS